MKYYCLNCGEVFDESDIETRSECVGEFWGMSAYESYACCPNCGCDEIAEVECENCIFRDTDDCCGNGIRPCDVFSGE